MGDNVTTKSSAVTMEQLPWPLGAAPPVVNQGVAIVLTVMLMEYMVLALPRELREHRRLCGATKKVRAGPSAA